MSILFLVLSCFFSTTLFLAAGVGPWLLGVGLWITGTLYMVSE